MRITQAYTILRFFKPHVFKKYGFVDYYDPSKPAVFYGLYPSSSRKLLSHKSFAVVVWCGSDALFTLKNASFVQFLRQNTGRIKHIAISNFIEADLTKAGLPYISLPLTSMDMNLECVPRGRSLYVYGGVPDAQAYQTSLCREIARKCNIPIVVAYKDTYSRSQLINQVYPSCFLGLRLLHHDGLSNTVCELGLMGRKVVWNGNTPNAIRYSDAKSILQIVNYEMLHHKENNEQIAKDVANYINIDLSFLQTEFWQWEH